MSWRSGDNLPTVEAFPEATAWITPGRFAAILAVFVLAAFPDVILGGRSFFYRDFAIFGYPLAHFQRQAFWQATAPLWNPFNNAGLPFLAQWNTMTLYPPALFYLLLPLDWSLPVFCLLHQLLAGLGMYWLAYRWTSNRLAAAVAGLAYAFNGLTLSCVKWPNNIAALGWMPWVVLTAEQSWQGNRRSVIRAAFIGALQMLTGAPEVVLFTWLIVSALWLGRCWRLVQLNSRQSGGPVASSGAATNLQSAAGNDKARALRRLAIRFGLVILLVTGLAAAQLLPFFELLSHSSHERASSTAIWAMPWWGWANLIVPLFRCFPSHQGVFAQFGQYWISSYYTGVGVLALALWAVWKARGRRVMLLAMIAAIGLVLALGDRGGLYAWLRHLMPPADMMRFPIKFVVLTLFAVPLLAAFGVNHLSQLVVGAVSLGCKAPEQQKPTPIRKPEYVLTLQTSSQSPEGTTPNHWRYMALLLGWLLVLTLAILWFAYQFPSPRSQWAVTVKSGLSRWILAVLSLGCLRLICLLARAHLQPLLGLGLLVLLWLDALTHAPRLNPTVAAWVYQPDSPAFRLFQFQPRPRLGESRAMISPDAEFRIDHLAFTNAVSDVLCSRQALFCNCNLLDAIPKVDGFYSLYLREEQQVRSFLYATLNADHPCLADFLGVSQVTATDKITEWRVRPSWLPLITTGQQPVYADGPTTLRALTNSAFDPRRVVYLPLEAKGTLLADGKGDAKITSQRITAQKIELELEATGPSLIVAAQAYYPCWRAYVNGQPVGLWRANNAFQAIEAPPGRSRIQIIYEDSAFYCGAILSLATLVGCLLYLLVGGKGRPGKQGNF